MKVVKEAISNVKMDDKTAVIDPVIADAVEFSERREKEVEKIIKERTPEPEKQPKIEMAKINLDEAMEEVDFEEDEFDDEECPECCEECDCLEEEISEVSGSVGDIIKNNIFPKMDAIASTGELLELVKKEFVNVDPRFKAKADEVVRNLAKKPFPKACIYLGDVMLKGEGLGSPDAAAKEARKAKRMGESFDDDEIIDFIKDVSLTGDSLIDALMDEFSISEDEAEDYIQRVVTEEDEDEEELDECAKMDMQEEVCPDCGKAPCECKKEEIEECDKHQFAEGYSPFEVLKGRLPEAEIIKAMVEYAHKHDGLSLKRMLANELMPGGVLEDLQEFDLGNGEKIVRDGTAFDMFRNGEHVWRGNISSAADAMEDALEAANGEIEEGCSKKVEEECKLKEEKSAWDILKPLLGEGVEELDEAKGEPVTLYDRVMIELDKRMTNYSRGKAKRILDTPNEERYDSNKGELFAARYDDGITVVADDLTFAQQVADAYDLDTKDTELEVPVEDEEGNRQWVKKPALTILLDEEELEEQLEGLEGLAEAYGRYFH